MLANRIILVDKNEAIHVMLFKVSLFNMLDTDDHFNRLYQMYHMNPLNLIWSSHCTICFSIRISENPVI